MVSEVQFARLCCSASIIIAVTGTYMKYEFRVFLKLRGGANPTGLVGVAFQESLHSEKSSLRPSSKIWVFLSWLNLRGTVRPRFLQRLSSRGLNSRKPMLRLT